MARNFVCAFRLSGRWSVKVLVTIDAECKESSHSLCQSDSDM